MLTSLGALLAVVVPFALLGALLHLVTRREQRRIAAASRQVVVTDAIHRELGFVVAPVVRKRLWGRWQLLIPVPFDRPQTVARVLDIAHRAFALSDRIEPGRFEIVLSQQENSVRRSGRAALAARSSRGESVSWT